MKNGFRQVPQAGRKERIREMDAELKNLSMASRISQMMTQQLMQNLKGMHDDISRSLNVLNELQYKILAIQEASGLDVAKLNEIANRYRLADFNQASDKEDAEQGFTVSDVVNEASTVILTSTTEEKDRGIFRSRLKLSECGVPDLIKAFMGREVGAKALLQLNGVDHEVELLAIRQPAAVVSPVAEANSLNGAGAQSSSTDAAPAQTAGLSVVGNA